MNKLFVSYSYAGKKKNDFAVYRGFGNAFLLHIAPVDEEEIEVLTSIVNQKVGNNLGMESITCHILFFVQVGI